MKTATHTPTPLEGTNGIECLSCKKLHTHLGKRFCDFCSQNLSLKEKISLLHGTTHTPTPWHLHDMETGVICTAGTLPIVDCKLPGLYEPEQKANAAFIVRAVNCHEELLDALKQLHERASMQYPHFEQQQKFLDLVAQTIANAEGK